MNSHKDAEQERKVAALLDRLARTGRYDKTKLQEKKNELLQRRNSV